MGSFLLPPPLSEIVQFCSRLDFAGRKALITLARSQSFPDPHTSPILYSKTSLILDLVVDSPPYFTPVQKLLPIGDILRQFITSPLLCGLVISFALGVELSEEQIMIGKRTSFVKELLATQTPRLPSEWNWRALISPSRYPNEVIHPLFPRATILQLSFASNVSSLLNRYRYRTILPHYTRRGVSSETSSLLLHRISNSRIQKVYGNRQYLHKGLDRSNVTSRDIVHHYLRTGHWCLGRTEMKQRWYPSGLLPRTYFSWSGGDIAVASYLRNFFNDLGDCFLPSQRHNRVQPSWLQRDTPSDEFVFYDLTSFTSWFHEQVPFLRAIADRCRGIPVHLVGVNLTITERDLGSLIHGYTDMCNDFPEFVVNDGIVDQRYRDVSFFHQCAGFLGIPGNLITCTIPHALAQASLQEHPHALQVPGDDVGAKSRSREHRKDIMICASTLGSLQFDKVYFTPQICIYLKRLVLVDDHGINLAPMLIYPLLPYLIDPNTKFRSSQFRFPDRDVIPSRTAAVLVSFHRDLWRHTRGRISSQSAAIIYQFILMVHHNVGLPLGAIFQGRLYGGDDDTDGFRSIKLKFSYEDERVLFKNPDAVFAAKYVSRMSVRDTSGVEVTCIRGSLTEGEIITVRRKRAWTFLEDMGYVQILGIPGEVVELVGDSARDAFLSAREPDLRTIRILCELDASQLGVLDLLEEDVSTFHVPEDVVLRSWHYRPYFDLDDPRVTGRYGRASSWGGVDDPFASRDSASPEPVDISDLY